MNNADIYAEMAKVAEPVIEHYHDDFRKHDRKIISEASDGDVFLWAPRKCGSHLILVCRGQVPNKSARTHFEAVRSLEPDLDWHGIPVGQHGIVRLSETGACDILAAWEREMQRRPDMATTQKLYL